MPKLNPISAKKLIKILLEIGFHEIRIKGSHHFFSHGNGKTTVVPIHGNEDISVGLLKKILRDIDIDVELYEKLRVK
ncbi:MAG: type II toxin-antitoxin system HicA family toxin [Candidatus Absconditabacteria bacterium]